MMKPQRMLASALLLLALLAATTSTALAWPDQPPDKATISGPGIKGDVEITDKDTLAALKLGAIEDFSRGVIAKPQVSGQGYKITRYFYGATFNFATLHYYPDAAGGHSYLYFEDGPGLRGSHTPFNGQWLYATAAGEAAMQHLLHGMGVIAVATALPAPVVAPLASPVVADNPFLRLVWLAALAGLALVVSGSVIRHRRNRAR